MKKVFTIIKGESERVPGKNFLDLAGKPLWRWLIDELGDFDLYINTDSESLYNELEESSNATAIKRSQKHIDWELRAGELGSPVMDMVKEFCESHLDSDEDFALVHVTSPFLKSETLASAFELFNNRLNHSVHSVKSIQDFMMCDSENGLMPMNFSFDRVSRTQDLSPVYQSLGAFFVLNSKNLSENNYQRLTSTSIAMPISNLESVEIDTVDDFAFANILAKSICH